MNTKATHRRHPGRPRTIWDGFTRWILHARGLRHLADRQVCELRFTTARSGRAVVLPVIYARDDDTVVILVGKPERKEWWRNFHQPRQVHVWLRGADRSGTAHVVEAHSPQRFEASAIYAAKFPDLPVGDDPLVVLTLDENT